MTVLRFVPVALVLLLAGAAGLAFALGVAWLGATFTVLALAAVGLVVWARRTATSQAPPLGYVERERSLW